MRTVLHQAQVWRRAERFNSTGGPLDEVLAVSPQRWTESAGCMTPGGMAAHEAAIEVAPNMQRGPQGMQIYKRAASFCAPCPVREACLQDALASEDGSALSGRWGIRGGLNPAQRLELAAKATDTTARTATHEPEEQTA